MAGFIMHAVCKKTEVILQSTKLTKRFSESILQSIIHRSILDIRLPQFITNEMTNYTLSAVHAMINLLIQTVTTITSKLSFNLITNLPYVHIVIFLSILKITSYVTNVRDKQSAKYKPMIPHYDFIRNVFGAKLMPIHYIADIFILLYVSLGCMAIASVDEFKTILNILIFVSALSLVCYISTFGYITTYTLYNNQQSWQKDSSNRSNSHHNNQQSFRTKTNQSINVYISMLTLAYLTIVHEVNDIDVNTDLTSFNIIYNTITKPTLTDLDITLLISVFMYIAINIVTLFTGILYTSDVILSITITHLCYYSDLFTSN